MRLVDADGTVIATDGEPVRDGRVHRGARRRQGAPARDPRTARRRRCTASERRLLDVIVAQLDAALERTDLTATAREAGALAETDQVRTALLSAVSHDLRRPLAAAVAAIGGLRAAGAEPLGRGPARTARDRGREPCHPLDARHRSARRQPRSGRRARRVVRSGGCRRRRARDRSTSSASDPSEVDLALDPDLPPLLADPVLLQRVLVNVLANAVRHCADGHEGRCRDQPSRQTGRAPRDRPRSRRAGAAFATRCSRRSSAWETPTTRRVSASVWRCRRGSPRAWAERSRPEDTPGGGLTMVIALPLARHVDAQEAP